MTRSHVRTSAIAFRAYPLGLDEARSPSVREVVRDVVHVESIGDDEADERRKWSRRRR